MNLITKEERAEVKKSLSDVRQTGSYREWGWLRLYEDTVTELEGQLEQAVKLLKYYANDYNEHCGNCDQFQTVEGDEDILKFLSQLEKGDNHGD